eukprot:TRINITY_DN4822_c0_g1_i2.p1 TRINITY_DN4822_c0_g1~~TRINITY_DN4822_c0_g1_i2.p1  ORF type:complete len:103 (+),score=6.87 TRINITY_DN4822_c0_g1_i2:263-571(+)
MSVIKGHKARELISSSLVQVSDTDTIGQVLNVLLEHKFMSVPVANPDGVVYVFVDCFDLVLFILSRVQNGDHDVYELPVSGEHFFQFLWILTYCRCMLKLVC